MYESVSFGGSNMEHQQHVEELVKILKMNVVLHSNFMGSRNATIFK